MPSLSKLSWLLGKRGNRVLPGHDLYQTQYYFYLENNLRPEISTIIMNYYQKNDSNFYGKNSVGIEDKLYESIIAQIVNTAFYHDLILDNSYEYAFSNSDIEKFRNFIKKDFESVNFMTNEFIIFKKNYPHSEIKNKFESIEDSFISKTLSELEFNSDLNRYLIDNLGPSLNKLRGGRSIRRRKTRGNRITKKNRKNSGNNIK